MIVDLKIDTTSGDLAFLDYDLVLVAGVERIRQQISLRLKMFRGEFPLDTQMGMPWLTEVFVKNPDRPVIEAYFKAEIMAVLGVNEITAFTSTYDKQTRKWTVTCTVSSTEGLVSIEEIP